MASFAPFVITAVITFLILLAFISWLFIANANETGPFAPYTPQLAEGLVQPLPDSAFAEPTPEIIQKRTNMICNSWYSLPGAPSPPDICNSVTRTQV